MPGSLYNQARAAKRVIIRPTGPLASLPLEALDSIGSANYDDSGSGSLIDIFPPFVYVDSSSAFAAHRSARRKPPGSDKQAGTFSALLVGNPEFNRSERSPATAPTSAPVTLLASISRGIEEEAAQITALDQVRLYGGKLKPLPAASREVEVLDLLFKRHGGRSHLLSGRSATIAQVEYAVEGCNILHMATHGLTGSRNRPYDASLALAQPAVPTPSDIGFLTLNRLVESWRGKLQQCDLVVLSACDTQRGVKRGDSVMALPWGFMYAGAPTVVASLWQVDDLSTSILMEEFYRNLLEKKLGKAEALHAAKRTLQDMSLEEVRRHSGMSAEQFTDYAARGLGQGIVKIPKGRLRSAAPYAHPYYWAAFVLIGDPQ
jgi:CHAT domain-containing protein